MTEALRRRPYAVVLFDELEKASADFSDILLQILDDGRLTDNKGRRVSFRNAVIIMTTNSTDLEKDFKPEVLGRIDSMLEYQPLAKEVMRRLVERELSALNAKLVDKKVSLSFSDSLYEAVAERGYDPQFGARPLRAAFQKIVTRPLSRALVAGELGEGAFILSYNQLRGEAFVLRA